MEAKFAQMSGRTGRGRGRGGRGFTSRKQQKSNYKKTLDDYCFYLGSSKQAADYELTLEYLMNYIKKTYDHGDDIVEALTTLQPPDTSLWLPKLQVSIAEDEAVIAIEEKQNMMLFKARLDKAIQREELLNKHD